MHKRVEVEAINVEAFRAVPGSRELVIALIVWPVAEEFAPIRGRAVRCALLHRVGAREVGVTGAAFAAVVHKLKGLRARRSRPLLCLFVKSAFDLALVALLVLCGARSTGKWRR